MRAPIVLGHEASGHVVKVGPGVGADLVGQRVAIEPGQPDLSCEQCLTGHYNLCPDMKFMATPPFDGAFAEYVTAAALSVHPLPDSISDDEGAMLEPLSVAIWAVQRANVGPGSRVLITGAGPIGLLCLQMAGVAGASVVTVTDIRDDRLRVAASLGASQVANLTQDAAIAPHDVLLECSGNPDATRLGIYSLSPAGRAVLVGMGPSDVSLPVARLQSYEISVTGAFRYANTWPTAIRLVAAGQVDLGRLITHHYTLGDVESALLAARHGAIKAIVNIGNTPS